ncbi:TraB/GumN family protein [Alkalicoccus halolimnae]|uniref:TraB/GumN family protein n=1 Tax=Alkalicoccus halolimnae TaxID=1667239 RepID=A0A5C7FCL5_9BACI|nr:TraB/GumN family protein [Alkalicoccus halolimnae]TXF85087.1 TraB/GumN family protein [Alkalicoccus halolimnae]
MLTIRSSFYCISLLLLLISGCSDEPPVFEDAALEKAVLENVPAENPENISQESMNSLTVLSSEYPVTSLNGIESFSALEKLHLPEAEIENASALLELEHINEINIGSVMLDQAQQDSSIEVLLELKNKGVNTAVPSFHYSDNLHEGPSEGILYEITHDGNTMYLFGSIHAGTEDFYPLRSKVENAYKEADQLAVEYDITVEEPPELEEAWMESLYDGEFSLYEEMEEDSAKELKNLLSRNHIDSSVLANADPWLVSLIISDLALEKSSFTPEYGVDLYFLEKSHTRNLSVISLETPSDQLRYMDEQPFDEQLTDLEKQIETLDTYEEDLNILSEAWKKGDIDFFRFLRTFDEQTEHLGMDERDEMMAEKLANLLNENGSFTTFVVVGSLHLAGENSIPSLLEEEGFKVQRHD